MPELPEVQTTVDGLNRTVRGKIIRNVWSEYKSKNYKNKEEIKNPKYFKKFKEEVVGKKILNAERRAKNILIHLSGRKTILVHMKMTGHLLFGDYDKSDPFNAHIRLRFDLSGGKNLYFSDMRKFAKVTLINTADLETSPHLNHLGPEPLEPSFKLEAFSFELLKRSRGKIKQVLMDQTIIVGIGNIYSDEILWRANVHPLSKVGKIPKKNLRLMFKAMKEVLKRGIDLGGDSMSDYRNIDGKRGKFQDQHKAYQKHKTKCLKRGCKGVLERTVVGGRGAHFCPKHQKLFV